MAEKTSKPKAKKEKEPEVESNSFPPFSFDGSNALKSKLVLNLRNCQYNLFRDIAALELGWRVIDQNGKVLEAMPKQVKSNENSDEESTGETGETGAPSKIEKFRTITDHHPDNWDIFWADSGMTPDFLSSLGNNQRCNHFLGMYNICRKSTLGMHLKRFQKEFPDHYKFFPQTWMYPAEFHDIQRYSEKKTESRKQKIEDGKMTEAQSESEPIALFICKPESGSQGRGIFIHQKVEEMRL